MTARSLEPFPRTPETTAGVLNCKKSEDDTPHHRCEPDFEDLVRLDHVPVGLGQPRYFEPGPYYTPIVFGSMTRHGLANIHDIDDSLPWDVRAILHEIAANYEGQAGIFYRQEHDRLVEEMRGPFTVTEVDPNVCGAQAFALRFFILADNIACAVNMPPRGKNIANSVATIVVFQVGFAVPFGLDAANRLSDGGFIPKSARGVTVLSITSVAALFLLSANTGTTPALLSFANSEFDGAGAHGAGLVRAVHDHLRNLLTALNHVLLAFIEAVSKTEELRLC